MLMVRHLTVLSALLVGVGSVLCNTGVSFSSVLTLAQSSSSMPAVPAGKTKQWQPPDPAGGARSAASSTPLTSEQQKDLDKAKSEVQRLKQEESTRSSPKQFPDKKAELWQRITLQRQGLQASRQGNLYAALSSTSRPGVFMISMKILVLVPLLLQADMQEWFTAT
jgi:hypothetical protein